MTKTTAANPDDLTAEIGRRLSALLERLLTDAEGWEADDDGSKVRRRADAITALTRAAAAIARLTAPLAPLDPQDGVATQARPVRAKLTAAKPKAPSPENETPMNVEHSRDPAELDALRDAAFERLDRLARLLEQKSETERPERGGTEPPSDKLDAERAPGPTAAAAG